jgi:hypothetical protein
MQFLFPGFLWALLALVIPIIIHLFYFRRFKTVYFTNVKFLKEIKEETSSRNKLKNLLILLMRCLAITCLVFAFAQPFLPGKEKITAGSRAVGVFIDNSFSMQAVRDDIPLIDIAKDRATQIVSAYEDETKFQVLTNDLEGRHLRNVGKEEALSLIEEIRISPSVRSISSIVNRQQQILKEENNISYLISDFQKSVFDLEADQDSNFVINLLPVQSYKESNVSIDSAWFYSPIPVFGKINLLLVKLSNHSNETAEKVRVSLSKDGEEKPFGLLNIPAGGTAIDTIAINITRPGLHQAEIRISDYPVQFDDKLFISFEVPEKLQVLEISTETQANRFLSAALRGIPNTILENQQPDRLDYQRFSEFDMIIISKARDISSGWSAELKNYLENGGKLLFFPDANTELSSVNNFLGSAASTSFNSFEKTEREVGKINTEEFIFSEVFDQIPRNISLPTSSGNFPIRSIQGAGAEKLMEYRDGSSFLNKYRVGDGLLYLCAAPLDSEFSNFPASGEIFVPFLFRAVISGAKVEPLFYTIGNDNLIEIKNIGITGDKSFKIKGKTEFIPGQINMGRKIILDMKDQISQAGYYDIMLDNEIIKNIAFNFNRMESDMAVYSSSELASKFNNTRISVIKSEDQANISRYISNKDKGTMLWKWFLLATLLFLLIETLLVRILKGN